MAKWKSPLFSDIRNKLGESAVFSIWKGRPYFRSYVVPANPRTDKQQAHRDVLAKIVAWYQTVVDETDEKAEWNAEALDEQISGYNLFTKYGRKTKVSCPATANGTGSADILVTYTLGLPANRAALFMFDGETWTDETPVDGLEAGDDKTVTVTVTSSDTYTFGIAYTDALVDGDSAPQNYQVVTKWTPDEANGVAKEAVCEATVS